MSMGNHIVRILSFILLILSISSFSIDEISLTKCQQLIDEKKYDEAINFANKKLTLFEEEKDIDSMLEMLQLKAKAYTHQYKFDEGLVIYKEYTNFAKANHRNNEYAVGLGSQSSIYTYKGEYDTALILSHKILQINDIDSSNISNAYTNLSSLYSYKDQQDSAMLFAQKAVDIDLALNDHSSLPFSLSTLAKGFEKNGDLDKALELYLEGITYLRTGQDDFKMATFNKLIAEVFLKLNNYEKAEEYIQKSIKIAQNKNIILTLSYSRFIEAILLQHNDKENEAQKVYEEILQVFNEKGRNDRAVECYASLGLIAINQGRLKDAKSLIEKGEEKYTALKNNQIIYDLVFAQVKYLQTKKKFVAAENKLLNLKKDAVFVSNPRLELRYLSAIINLKKEQGQFNQAIKFIDRKTKLSKKLDLKKQAFFISELEAKYHQVEDAKKIESLNNENRITSLLVQKKNYQLYGVLIFLSIALLTTSFIYSQNKKIKLMLAELKIKNEKIASALQEKEILLKEIHHRVKNNLQIVSSLLNMQSRDVQEQTAKDALNESKNRVHSMAMIHQELYQLKNIVGINSKNYIEKLTKNLMQSYSTSCGDITLINNIEEIDLDVDTSIPLGLIINELITNSLKYAFPNKMNGKIELTLKRCDNYLHLTVSDNGVGMDNSSSKSTNSFGLKMVRIFALKLNAEWEILKDSGTTISLKIKNYKLA